MRIPVYNTVYKCTHFAPVPVQLIWNFEVLVCQDSGKYCFYIDGDVLASASSVYDINRITIKIELKTPDYVMLKCFFNIIYDNK